MELLSDDVMQLFLKLPSSERLQFLAGQYIQVIMKNGKRRSFSLANSPSDDEFLELHVRHVPDGAWTDHVFQNMKIKEILRIEGPFGEFFWRDESTGPAIFVAGGTGFAPVKSILEALFERQVQQALYLYWGVRRQRDLYMLDTVEQWARRYRNFQFIPVLSEAGADADWKGRRGWVHEAVLEDFVELSRCAVYAAGPPVMVQAAQRAFPGRGLLPERFYSDAFTYARD
jgi:CDP-4-dehydro-6-deoxyglucose reductase